MKKRHLYIGLIMTIFAVSIPFVSYASQATDTLVDADESLAYAYDEPCVVPPAPVSDADSSSAYTKGELLGNFKITAYSSEEVNVGTITASGIKPRSKHTIASDWDVIPAGTKIMIEGSDIVYTVEDSGVHGNTIDIFFDTSAECYEFGIQHKNIYKVN